VVDPAEPFPRTPVHVTVVGDLGMDVRVIPTSAVVRAQDTPARITSTPGGAGANTAAGLARLGVPVSLIARIGDDIPGATAAAEIGRAGVDCRLTIDSTLPTCCVVVIVHPDGERTMLSDRGAGSRLAPEDIALPDVPGRGHLHLSGYVLFDGGSRPAGLAAMDRARRRGWTVSVDPQSATHIAAVGPALFREWVSGADLVLPNVAELSALGGPDPLLDVVTAIAVTDGPKGAIWHGRDGSVAVPSQQVHRVDSTGAGDAFNAGFLSAWLFGSEPAQALASGIEAGSVTAGRHGARSDDPGPSDVPGTVGT
jgi:sugar/nucleoside kinase (ribokinase family)